MAQSQTIQSWYENRYPFLAQANLDHEGTQRVLEVTKILDQAAKEQRDKKFAEQQQKAAQVAQEGANMQTLTEIKTERAPMEVAHVDNTANEATIAGGLGFTTNLQAAYFPRADNVPNTAVAPIANDAPLACTV